MCAIGFVARQTVPASHAETQHCLCLCRYHTLHTNTKETPFKRQAWIKGAQRAARDIVLQDVVLGGFRARLWDNNLTRKEAVSLSGTDGAHTDTQTHTARSSGTPDSPSWVIASPVSSDPFQFTCCSHGAAVGTVLIWGLKPWRYSYWTLW